jgi:hypothetical protein
MFGNHADSSLFPLNVDIDPPDIELQGSRNYLLPISGELIFTVRAKDQGGSGVSGSSLEARFKPSEDGEWTEWGSFGSGGVGTDLILSDMLPLTEGDYRVQFRVLDMVGNMGTTGEINISIVVPMEDLPPSPVISSPANGSSFRLGEPIELDATGTTDDELQGTKLTLTWFSNITGYIHSGGKGKKYLPPGSHRITLYVDDGVPGHNISTFVDIDIYDPDDTDHGQSGDDDGIPDDDGGGDPTWMIAVLVLSILGVAGGVSFMLMRRKRDDEVMIGITGNNTGEIGQNEEE